MWSTLLSSVRIGKVSLQLCKDKTCQQHSIFFSKNILPVDNTRKKKDSTSQSVLLLKRSKYGHFKAQLKQRRVIMFLQIVRKKLKRKIMAEFIRIIYHYFVFKQRLNHGIRCIKYFNLFSIQGIGMKTTTKQKSNCQFFFL